MKKLTLTLILLFLSLACTKSDPVLDRKVTQIMELLNIDQNIDYLIATSLIEFEEAKDNFNSQEDSEKVKKIITKSYNKHMIKNDYYTSLRENLNREQCEELIPLLKSEIHQAIIKKQKKKLTREFYSSYLTAKKRKIKPETDTTRNKLIEEIFLRQYDLDLIKKFTRKIIEVNIRIGLKLNNPQDKFSEKEIESFTNMHLKQFKSTFKENTLLYGIYYSKDITTSDLRKSIEFYSKKPIKHLTKLKFKAECKAMLNISKQYEKLAYEVIL